MWEQALLSLSHLRLNICKGRIHWGKLPVGRGRLPLSPGWANARTGSRLTYTTLRADMTLLAGFHDPWVGEELVIPNRRDGNHELITFHPRAHRKQQYYFLRLNGLEA